MAKLGTLIATLAAKVGIDNTSDELKDILAITSEVPDDIATALETKLLTVDAAKNNRDIRNAIKAEVLNGADAKLNDLIEEFGIEVNDDYKGEKNTYEKISRLGKLIAETTAKKAGAGSKTEKGEFEKQLTELNAQLKAAKESLLAKEKEFSETRNSDLTSFEIQKILLGKDYSLPKEMDADLKISTAQSAINKQLASKGLKIVREEDGTLKIVTKDNLPAYSEKNEPLELHSYIDGALAQNKLLRVNDPKGGDPEGKTGSAGVITGGQSNGNAAIVSEIDAQLKAFN